MALVGYTTPTSEQSPCFVNTSSLFGLLCLVLTVLGTSCNSVSLYYLPSCFLSQLFKHVWDKHPLLNYLRLK